MTVKKKLKPVVLGKGDVKDDQSKGNRNFSSIYFKTIIEPDGTYRITDLSIPAPQLVSAVTDLNGKITIKGHAIPAGHPITTDIEKQYMSFNEAKTACGKSVLPFGKKWECMKEKTGVESIWKDAIRKVASCGLKLSCMGNIDNLRHVEYFSQETYKLQHSMVGLYKDVQNSSYISHLWNGSPDSSFQFNVTLDQEVHAGEYVKAASVIFGSFQFNGMKIDYRGLNTEDAKLNHGLGSGFSNSLRVESIPEFQNVVTNPVKYCGDMQTVFWTSGFYSPRCGSNGCHYHSAVDISEWGGCDISAIYKGYAFKSQKGGKTVEIHHSDRYSSLYAHGAKYHGNYDAETGEKRYVKTGEKIMYMGNTGNVVCLENGAWITPSESKNPQECGRHLHFAIFDYGNAVNPEDYIGKYLNNMIKTF